jgi:hypothetical protein
LIYRQRLAIDKATVGMTPPVARHRGPLIALCNSPTRQPPPWFGAIELVARVDEGWRVEALSVEAPLGVEAWDVEALDSLNFRQLSRLPCFGRRNQSPSVSNHPPATGDFRRGSSGVLR